MAEEEQLREEFERFLEANLTNEWDKLNVAFYLNEYETNSCDFGELLAGLQHKSPSATNKLMSPSFKFKLMHYIWRLYVEPRRRSGAAWASSPARAGAIELEPELESSATARRRWELELELATEWPARPGGRFSGEASAGAPAGAPADVRNLVQRHDGDRSPSLSGDWRGPAQSHSPPALAGPFADQNKAHNGTDNRPAEGERAGDIATGRACQFDPPLSGNWKTSCCCDDNKENIISSKLQQGDIMRTTAYSASLDSLQQLQLAASNAQNGRHHFAAGQDGDLERRPVRYGGFPAPTRPSPPDSGGFQRRHHEPAGADDEIEPLSSANRSGIGSAAAAAAAEYGNPDVIPLEDDYLSPANATGYPEELEAPHLIPGAPLSGPLYQERRDDKRDERHWPPAARHNSHCYDCCNCYDCCPGPLEPAGQLRATDVTRHHLQASESWTARQMNSSPSQRCHSTMSIPFEPAAGGQLHIHPVRGPAEAHVISGNHERPPDVGDVLVADYQNTGQYQRNTASEQNNWLAHHAPAQAAAARQSSGWPILSDFRDQAQSAQLADCPDAGGHTWRPAQPAWSLPASPSAKCSADLFAGQTGGPQEKYQQQQQQRRRWHRHHHQQQQPRQQQQHQQQQEFRPISQMKHFQQQRDAGLHPAIRLIELDGQPAGGAFLSSPPLGQGWRQRENSNQPETDGRAGSIESGGPEPEADTETDELLEEGPTESLALVPSQAKGRLPMSVAEQVSRVYQPFGWPPFPPPRRLLLADSSWPTPLRRLLFVGSFSLAPLRRHQLAPTSPTSPPLPPAL